MFKQLPKKTIFIIGIGLLCITIATWFMQSSGIKKFDQQSNIQQGGQIDYYIKQFTTRVFQKDGTLDYILQGAELNHYKHNNQIIIEQPLLTYQEKDTWTISGEQAITAEGLNQTITFKENALMQSDGEEALLIKANKMSFSPNTKLFIANSNNNENNVYISWKNGNIIGSEINANLLEEKFTLKNAQAIYQTP